MVHVPQRARSSEHGGAREGMSAASTTFYTFVIGRLPSCSNVYRATSALTAECPRMPPPTRCVLHQAVIAGLTTRGGTGRHNALVTEVMHDLRCLNEGWKQASCQSDCRAAGQTSFRWRRRQSLGPNTLLPMQSPGSDIRHSMHTLNAGALYSRGGAVSCAR